MTSLRDTGTKPVKRILGPFNTSSNIYPTSNLRRTPTLLMRSRMVLDEISHGQLVLVEKVDVLPEVGGEGVGLTRAREPHGQ